MSDERENNLTDELAELLQTTGIISQVLEPCKVNKQTRLRICKTFAVRIPVYCSESWTLKKQAKSRIATGDMNRTIHAV